MLYQDVISAKEEIIRMVNEDDWAIIDDSKYYPIIIALRKGPMTVRDLEIEYNKIIVKNIDEMDLTKKEKDELKDKLKRKSKTLYKYLDVLIKHNIVIEAGRRIKKGQTASETLYGRSAKLFINSNKKQLDYTSESSQRMFPILAKILSLELGIPEPNIDCLSNTMLTITNSVDVRFTDVFVKYSELITESLSTSSFDDITNLSHALILVLNFFSGKDFEKSFAKCSK
ncbi:MAG TPA: hypothetical protein VMZ29_00730 [Candidatus Bathyarchaeia archaeon]|nr:hypothetical protein [Candidatus Bathyarchaeia archaeon]